MSLVNVDFPATVSTEPGGNPFRYIAEEPIFLAAIPLAFLLQISNPDVARSMSVSDPPVQPLDQLRFTLKVMNIIHCSTAENPCRLNALVNDNNPQVKRLKYLSQPRMQRWVAASVFVAVVRVQDTFFGGFTKGAVNQLYILALEFSSSIEVPMDMWPNKVDDFWDFWEDHVDILPVTKEARMLANQVLYPRNAPLWARFTLLPLPRVWLSYWISSRQRECLGLRATLLNWLVYSLSVAIVSAIYPLLLSSIRHSTRYYASEIKYIRRKSKVERCFMVRHDE